MALVQNAGSQVGLLSHIPGANNLIGLDEANYPFFRRPAAIIGIPGLSIPIFEFNSRSFADRSGAFYDTYHPFQTALSFNSDSSEDSVPVSIHGGFSSPGSAEKSMEEGFGKPVLFR